MMFYLLNMQGFYLENTLNLQSLIMAKSLSQPYHAILDETSIY